jgi:hypothetical protein
MAFFSFFSINLSESGTIVEGAAVAAHAFLEKGDKKMKPAAV